MEIGMFILSTNTSGKVRSNHIIDMIVSGNKKTTLDMILQCDPEFYKDIRDLYPTGKKIWISDWSYKDDKIYYLCTIESSGIEDFKKICDNSIETYILPTP